MTLKTFLNFTRIQTLPAAVLSPIAGVLFSIYRFGSFHWLPTFLFFIGLISINLFVSAWNNLMDYKKALDPSYKEKENILSTRNISPRLALRICLIFLILDIVVGLGVVVTTNFAILPIGGLCFLIAIFYTYGPFAFSRWPLGEICAGLCEGFFGFFLGVYINSFDEGYLFVKFDGMLMTLLINWSNLLPIALVGLMCFALNFNIMLSDNICDLEQDLKNGRKTLPYFLKIPNALRLYVSTYFLAALIILLAITLNILPLWSFLMILIAPFLLISMRRFLKLQDKRTTFILQVRNLILVNGALAASLLLAILFK